MFQCGECLAVLFDRKNCISFTASGMLSVPIPANKSATDFALATSSATFAVDATAAPRLACRKAPGYGVAGILPKLMVGGNGI